MKTHLSGKLFAYIFLLGLFTSANAAIIDVTRLNIDSITTTINTPTFATDTTTYSPPAVWNMGEYQGVIFNQPLVNVNNVDVLLESTGVYGAPPPNGSVDTSSGTLDLNLRDLHMTFSGDLNGNFDLWNASTSTIESNTYDSMTGAFSYGWNDTTTLEYAITPLIIVATDVDYSIQISGTVSTIPIPPAVWLFASGLLGLMAVAQRRS